MDRLTRNAIIVSGILLTLLIVSLAWNRLGFIPRIWQLNALLQQDPVLTSYPYTFRAVLFVNGIVTLTSPHASVAPIEPFLQVIDASLAQAAPEDPAMLAARDGFWRQEMRAIELMIAQPDVDSVVWSLDRAWYHAHGIPLDSP